MGVFDYSWKLLGGAAGASPDAGASAVGAFPSAASSLSSLASGSVDVVTESVTAKLAPAAAAGALGVAAAGLDATSTVAHSVEASPSTLDGADDSFAAALFNTTMAPGEEFLSEVGYQLASAYQPLVEALAAAGVALASAATATLQVYHSGLESVCLAVPPTHWWHAQALEVGLDPSVWPPLVPSWVPDISTELPTCQSTLNIFLLFTLAAVAFRTYYLKRQVSPAHISTVRTRFNRAVLKKMTALSTPYRPTWWMSCGHATTVFGPIWIKPTGYPLPWVSELRRTPDLGVYTLTTLTPEAVRANDPERTTIVNAPHKSALPPLVVVIHHGVGGDYEDYYIGRLARRICLETNAHVVVHNVTGRAGAPVPYARVPAMCDTRDMYRTYDLLCERYPGIPLFSVGFSFGAGQLSAYLTQKGSHAPQAGAVLVAPPLDPAPNIHFLTNISKIGKYVYSRVMVSSLFAHFNKHRKVFDEVDIPGYHYGTAAQATTFWDFDNSITAPIAGYNSALAYYTDAATLHKLRRVRVPTLVMISRDDPVTINPPKDHDFLENPMIIAAYTQRGGHCAFPQGRIFPSENNYWSDNVILNWLDSVREVGTDMGVRLRRPDNHSPFFKPKHPYTAAKRAAADDMASTGHSLHHQTMATRGRDKTVYHAVGVPPSMPSLHTRSSNKSAGEFSDLSSAGSNGSTPSSWMSSPSMDSMSARSMIATAGMSHESSFSTLPSDSGAGTSPPVAASSTFGDPPVGSRARASSTSLPNLASSSSESENVVAEMRRMQRVLHGLRTELGVLIPAASKTLAASSSRHAPGAATPAHRSDSPPPPAPRLASPTAAQLESVLSDMRRDFGEGVADLNMPPNAVPEVPNPADVAPASAKEYASFAWSVLSTGALAGGAVYLMSSLLGKKPRRR